MMVNEENLLCEIQNKFHYAVDEVIVHRMTSK